MNSVQALSLPPEAYVHFKNTPGFDATAFAVAHTQGVPISIRRNLKKLNNADFSVPVVPWCTHALYLAERHMFSLDPLWHAGAYYVQEASSMFLHHVCKQLFTQLKPLLVLDACAAPGGKSTLLTDALPPGSLLVSNEIVPKRAGILYENMEKWGRTGTVVTQADTKQLAQVPLQFDAIVVDAPCTGSGLWRKQTESIAEWSLKAVVECSLRQQQIIKDVWPLIKPGGYLIYSTCSYSINENEDILDFIADNMDIIPVLININTEWGITLSQTNKSRLPCLRFYPYNLSGEGFFMGVVQNAEDSMENSQSLGSNPHVKKWKGVDVPFINLKDEISIFELEPNRLWAWPKAWEEVVSILRNKLPVKKAGVLLGEYKGKDFIPEHALAMSELISKETAQYYELDLESALKYLRKNTQWFEDMPGNWNIISYHNVPLGWVKKSGTRVNNYYPPAWRLRN